MTLLSIDWFFLIEKLLLISVVLVLSLVVAMYATWGERKVAAWIQDRLGPNRAGPAGLLQPLADGGKLFFKEEIIPTNSNRFLFILGPSIAMVVACMTSAVIPWGDTLTIAGREISLQVADVNIGILYIFAVVSMGVYGIMLGGWASNNKYSLLASVRAASQIISYELPMGLALIALLMLTGTLSLKEIVEQQRHGLWNICYQPLGFFIFLVCAFAECNRAPFDLPEAENELNGGYHLEYSSMKLGFFLFAEYINMFISSALMATMYFGGYAFPWMDKLGLSPNMVTILGFVALFIKTLLFIFFFMWVRWTVPRFRYDQLMRLGWRVLIPLALVNMLGTGAVELFKHH
ncbi:NADH-quinone oxidoreductase subunit H [Chitinophaga terrae (ex Kim and Jung 2007)]|jgi:NADH-quinone oxidoreductase subunit H|uniref:NADH-quinone oxidoreductase subunit H n=1 Tax=Chitinophaga terrae (ex Kim and Jung 2007) TaxID=408074 RepID=A0A1H4DN14_9BACT|nr:NADH-quinone oxidoreductase subunit NuoH [Chitinophaga terrae (ex Kim and Jung 2007)]MDQ0107844.1 NADH-quinone oxidoreductase subunit H [Chitinophaga terrae (ex Kim and Jung 2007)]GEP91018.1 NADH-quinone oxidoreductase subunit H [Chitinophaga terrae (ex Kim and Jung 2007)]SEA74134.1 NADH-quinone oxidoreductase subunit H [Chitinophaga terrae (ex Kim and Jung 2007)]